jgi:hypothetical protein
MAYGWPAKRDPSIQSKDRRPNGYGKKIKKFQHRKMRRLARQDPENAPTKPIHFGYET